MTMIAELTGQIERIALERFELMAATVLKDYPSLQHAACHVDYHLAVRGLVMQFRTWAVKGVEGRPGYLHVPANWWEAFKAEVLPDWVTARWPVRYKPLSYTQYFVCPHSTVAWPDARHLDFLRDGPS